MPGEKHVDAVAAVIVHHLHGAVEAETAVTVFFLCNQQVVKLILPTHRWIPGLVDSGCVHGDSTGGLVEICGT